MAYEIPGFSFSLPAAADLSTHQYKFVVVDSNGRAALSGDGLYVAGVLQNKPNALGIAASIMGTGITKVVAGAAIAAGAAVTPDANGKAKTAATGDFVHGIALEAAAADLNVITILLQPRGDASA